MTSGRSALVRGFPQESSENYLRQHFDSKGYTIELRGIVRADEKEICVLFTTKEHRDAVITDKYHECQIEAGEYVELLISPCSPDMEQRFFNSPRHVTGTGQQGTGSSTCTPGGGVTRGPITSDADVCQKLTHATVSSTGAYSSPLIVGEQRHAFDKLERKREVAAPQTERKTSFLTYSDDDEVASLTEKNGESEKYTKGAPVTEFVSLCVHGFDPETDEETAEMFFENADRSGAGEFKSFHWDEDKREAIIVLQPEVAKRVQENEFLLLEGAKLQVRPLTPVAEEPESAATTIEVRGFKAGTTEETLALYFESPRRCDGGKVREVRILHDMALITFENPEVACRVLSHSGLLLKGAPLRVSAVLPGCREERQPEVISTILVEEFPDGTNEEQLTLFFENFKRAGGGKVKNVQLDQKQKVAYVTFEEAEVAQRVIAKGLKEGLDFRKKKKVPTATLR